MKLYSELGTEFDTYFKMIYNGDTILQLRNKSVPTLTGLSARVCSTKFIF